MREIKARGMLKSDGKTWVYGAYYKHSKVTLCPIGLTDEDIKDNEVHLIINGGFSDWNMPANLKCYEVIPETVGESTGLKDKNGTEIYEGDVIKVFGNITNPRTKELIPYNSIASVKYGENTACFLYHVIGSSVSSNFRYTKADGLNYEVIGNIHHNPELIRSE